MWAVNLINLVYIKCSVSLTDLYVIYYYQYKFLDSSFLSLSSSLSEFLSLSHTFSQFLRYFLFCV